MSNQISYKDLVIDIYDKIQKIKEPHADIYQIAADLYTDGDPTILPMDIMLMDKSNLTIKLITDLLKKCKKNHIRFKNINALENYIKNNVNYKKVINKNKNIN